MELSSGRFNVNVVRYTQERLFEMVNKVRHRRRAWPHDFFEYMRGQLWTTPAVGEFDQIESRVFLVVADRYGPALFEQSRLREAVHLIATLGSVRFVQQVLWSTTSTDDLLRETLSDALPALEQLTQKYPKAFVSEAESMLKRFRKPPASNGDSAPD